MADLTVDPTVVEEQVRRLNRQADSLGLLGVVAGVPVGAIVGGLPLVTDSPIPSKYGIATLLLGALLTGTLGYIIARGRSFGYRLKAQLLLGQLRLEQNVEALLAVSERPAVAALPAPAPTHALPEALRIEDLVDAGLAMPSHATVVEHAPAPPVEPEQTAPEVVPEPEPSPEPEPVQLPSWAADLERAVAAATRARVEPEPEPEPEPVAETTPEPEPEPEPVVEADPEPTWSLPVREEPVAAPEPPTWAAEPEEITPAPTPAPVLAPDPEPVPEPIAPVPVAPATVAAAPVAPLAPAAFAPAAFAPAPIAPAPIAPAPVAPPAVWAVPAAEEQPEPEVELAPPAPAATQDAPLDLSKLSIAEIARLVDAGSL